MNKEIDYKKLTSPCGIDCFNCELFEDNVTKEMQQRIGTMMGIPPEKVTCGSCRITGCLLIQGDCKHKSCVDNKGIEFCFECSEFPCNKLHPALDRADRLPHNMKMFNLCRIKNVGLEKWAKEESLEIRKRYKEGIIEIGNGPQLK